MSSYWSVCSYRLSNICIVVAPRIQDPSGDSINSTCELQRCLTFLCRFPESSLWSRAPLLAPCPRCPCVGRRWWRVTWFWAGWWGVVLVDCCGPRWASRWGSWERGPGCRGGRRCGPLWGWSASSEVYYDSCRKHEHLSQHMWEYHI